MGGDAISSIVFGDKSPSGKLPVTIYDSSLMEARPTIMDMSLRNNGGITYRYYEKTPLYPFGFGLYYTQFEYKYYNDTFNNNYNAFVKTVHTSYHKYTKKISYFFIFLLFCET